MGTGGTRVSMAAAGSAAGGGEGFWAARAACECGVEQKRRKEWGNYFAAQRMMVLLKYCILVWHYILVSNLSFRSSCVVFE
jgi:hypothetical protein